MAHFAELDDNNVVVRVLVIANSDVLDDDGNESEAVGKAFCEREFGGRWVQTSYNHRIRVRYAGVGMTYDSTRDAFLFPQPAPWFVIDETSLDWVCPDDLNPTTGEPWTSDQLLVRALAKKMEGLVIPDVSVYV